jgi:hypothetical protein
MGDATSKTFTGRFKIVKSGTANLVNNQTKDMYANDRGNIEIKLTRDGNMVTTYVTETWDKDGSDLFTYGTWYAEYNGANDTFKLYPAGKGADAPDRYEGKYVDGKMTG